MSIWRAPSERQQQESPGVPTSPIYEPLCFFIYSFPSARRWRFSLSPPAVSREAAESVALGGGSSAAPL